MSAFFKEPPRIPFYLKIGIWISEKITGKKMLPARILSWYPKAAIGSGVMESLTAHGKNESEKRLLRLVRLQTALAISCPFCIDMNSAEYNLHGISEEEFLALQNNFQNGYPASIIVREKLALKYAKLISATPLAFPTDFIKELKQEFTEREIVMLATTISQVNYWGRLVQSLGIPPAGFSKDCQSPKYQQSQSNNPKTIH